MMVRWEPQALPDPGANKDSRAKRALKVPLASPDPKAIPVWPVQQVPRVIRASRAWTAPTASKVPPVQKAIKV